MYLIVWHRPLRAYCISCNLVRQSGGFARPSGSTKANCGANFLFFRRESHNTHRGRQRRRRRPPGCTEATNISRAATTTTTPTKQGWWRLSTSVAPECTVEFCVPANVCLSGCFCIKCKVARLEETKFAAVKPLEASSFHCCPTHHLYLCS